MSLRVGTERQLDVFTRGCFGKNFVYPDSIRDIMRKAQGIDRKSEPEVVSMAPFFQKAVGDLVDIQSATGKVTVRKLVDSDYEDDRVSFRITQQNPVSMGDQIDTLRVTIPVSFTIDPAKTSLCRSRNLVDPSHKEDTIYDHLPEDAFIYTFETISIPVYLEAAEEAFSLRVEQEGEQLTAQVRINPIEMMDTGASWFAFLGEKYWFERRGETCVAKGPAQEGTVHFKVGAAHRMAEFWDPAGSAGTTRAAGNNREDRPRRAGRSNALHRLDSQADRAAPRIPLAA